MAWNLLWIVPLIMVLVVAAEFIGNIEKKFFVSLLSSLIRVKKSSIY